MSKTNNNRAVNIIAVGLLLVVGGIVAYVYFLQPAQQPAEQPAQPNIAAPDAGQPEVEAKKPDPPEPLSPDTLENPDDEKIRELAGELSANEEFKSWLENEYMLGKFVAVVENLSKGKVPRNLIIFLEPEGKFAVIEKEGVTILDTKSYSRYDHLAKAFASIDSGKAKRLIGRLMPWLEAKYREIGRPDLDFKGALALAIAEFLKVPLITKDIPLRPDPVIYKITIEELEAMSDAQKQLLRMGPENIRKIQAKLKEIGRALGMSEVLDKVRPIIYPLD